MRLSAHDASFLYTETASGPMHGITMFILDGAVTLREVRQFYAERIHLLPRFRQKLAFVPFNLAHPKWIDDPEFDLNHHIEAHAVPASTTVNRALEIALELGEPLLDRSRPLWKLFVIENVEGKTILVQLAHHAFVDGATSVAMTTVFSETSPDAEAPEPPATPWQPEPEPAPFSLWQEAVGENARAGVNQVQGVMATTQAAGEVAQKGLSLMQRMAKPVMQAPWNASLVGPKRSFARFTCMLTEIKEVKNALGGTINDVVVAAVAEGAARYLQSNGEVTEKQYLRLMCPVNVRDGDVDPKNLGGNRVSAMFPMVPAWPMTIAERYEHTRAELTEIKANGEPEVLDQLQKLQPNTPPVAMAQTLSVGTQWDLTAAAARAPLPILPHQGGQRPQQLGFNFTCTNLPGPTWTQYICGVKVEAILGTLMLTGNLGLGVGVGSVDDKFNFGFTADPRLVPDLARFAGYVEAAFAELQQAAQQATA